MNVFKAVKENITAREAAEHYGIKVSSKGMACCIFHDDKHPSMKLDGRYYCFGCGATGDATDLTAHLFGLSLKDAACKLVSDFNVVVPDTSIRRSKEKNPFTRYAMKTYDRVQLEFEIWKLDAFRILFGFQALMNEWEVFYAPKPDDDGEWDDRFCEALSYRAKLEHYLAVLGEGSIGEQINFYKKHREEVAKLGERLEQHRQSGSTGTGRDAGAGTADQGKATVFREGADPSDNPELSAGS